MLQDNEQRNKATDPSNSFIVQAPAGSGKTELLTQRYLRLLSTVANPEQIIAITFTRKAASEMRERIVQTLQKVAHGEHATSIHQQQTFQYATEALIQAKKLNWQLLEYPGRLRILTIDALCQMLSQAIPLADKHVPYAQISEEPTFLYEKAARACLTYALNNSELHNALKCLLNHLDNRQDKLIKLFADLLEKREQWLGIIYSARKQKKEEYELMLALIEEQALCRLRQSLLKKDQEELCTLSRQVACIESNHKTPRYHLREWYQFTPLNRETATGLAALLLTSEEKLRKSFDHHVGLKRGACEDRLYEELKKRSKILLNHLEENQDFIEALIKVKNLPPPIYNDEQWETLQALFTLLPLLTAHLYLLFKERNEVDFSAIAQQALEALGDEEQPTDLALYLDHSIQHLLIDEFQDTSIQQFYLLTKLVQGWQKDDGRTLFVVGDPMQSIYRFRQAEVGLFLKAQQEGIGPVELMPLRLSCNFRSNPGIVDWINQRFKTIFPQHDDIASGAISFHPAVAVLNQKGNSYVEAQQFPNRFLEARGIANFVITELKKNPGDTIAILVRSRNHLTYIVQELREKNIPFQGVEIELLATLPHLQDIWSLTQALLLPANRLAWLSLLRSPLCGLTLVDLHAIANFAKKKPIYYSLQHLHQIHLLSEEGKARAEFFYSIMEEALANRHQKTVSEWIASTFKGLQGELIFTPNQQADLEQFWLLLDQINPSGYPDLEQLKNTFDKLYSQRTDSASLQIMTIHKSKGLEFDCVILPALSAGSQNKDIPLLRWLKLPVREKKELLLVSPIKATYNEQCLLYNYLSQLDSEKELYELQRLLYVAVTRAKKRLLLFDHSGKETKKSFRTLLKQQIFNLQEEENLIPPMGSHPLLKRLPIAHYCSQLKSNKKDAFANEPICISSIENRARLLGIVSHELLQWICDYHAVNVSELPWHMVKNRLRGFGFDFSEQEHILQELSRQMEVFLSNPVGQWISKAHKMEHNEYEILCLQEEIPTIRIVDRTFLEENIRWVIDFKTGSENEEANYLHRQQVNSYAQLFALDSSIPIKCGLYYLASSHWVYWDYIKPEARISKEEISP